MLKKSISYTINKIIREIFVFFALTKIKKKFIDRM